MNSVIRKQLTRAPKKTQCFVLFKLVLHKNHKYFKFGTNAQQMSFEYQIFQLLGTVHNLVHFRNMYIVKNPYQILTIQK